MRILKVRFWCLAGFHWRKQYCHAGNDGYRRAAGSSNTGSVLHPARGISTSCYLCKAAVTVSSRQATMVLRLLGWHIVGNESGILRGARRRYSRRTSHLIAASLSPAESGWHRTPLGCQDRRQVKVLGPRRFGEDVQGSSDGTSSFRAGDDGTARTWDAKTGVELRALKGHSHLW